jgi:TRAP-type C4-dicarboxylate transport system permease large subunit
MTASLIGFSVLFVLCFLGLPLGWGMIAVGAIGLFTIRGWEAALFMTTQQILDFTMSYGLSVLPMFILMATTVAKFGIDPLHFGLLSVAALGIGLILPPIGLLLVVVCQIGNVSLSAVSRPMVPYILILVASLLAIAYVPAVTLILPRLLL